MCKRRYLEPPIDEQYLVLKLEERLVELAAVWVSVLVRSNHIFLCQTPVSLHLVLMLRRFQRRQGRCGYRSRASHLTALYSYEPYHGRAEMKVRLLGSESNSKAGLGDLVLQESLGIVGLMGE